ncbi:MAG: ATP-binding protein [Lachnospiraceae bacterium]|nr:ATP-binding protein [Lachnospiraceae bacterium]
MRKNQLENIRTGSYKKKYQVADSECEIVIEDAYYGDWKGHTEVLDEAKIEDMCSEILKVVAKHSTKYNPVPSYITLSHQISADNVTEEKSMLVSAIEPRYRLEQVALPQETREQLEVTLSAVRNRDRLNNEWGIADKSINSRPIVLNFYGYAGTGKSMTAEAIAEYLNKKYLMVNYSELESKYVGETPKNIKKVFQKAMEEDAVLVFDEADSFLSKRLTNITQSADYGVNITRSVMLMELEKFDGIVVFTTNLIENYDTAFRRRIFASVEFQLPDEEARIKIWKLHIGERLPVATDVSAEALAQQYENISGADIKDIVYYAAVYAMDKDQKQVENKDFEKAYQYVMKRYA